MSRPSDEDLRHEVTLRATGDSFADVDGLDPAIGEFARELGRGPGTEDRPQGPRLVPGTRIDEHLEIVRRLGAGGMGVVYLARDLRLDRDVAVKLVGAARTEDAAARLQREAQAMARLAHPNVVAVYEVGTFAGAVYVAMEYVDGGTVRQWQKDQPRRWDEILEVYLQAARGLAAAHSAGFVHRDFKPDNVLVGNDGRVRVADFGLARSWLTETGAIAVSPVSSSDRSFEHTTLTRSDAVVGTPGYMAPEQFDRREVGPAADQFAFGVALYEALYGERPYGSHAGVPIEMLVVRPAPPERDVPGWLRRVALRTVAPRPDDRFPDMHAVVHALERGRTRRARRRIAVLAVSGAAITAVVGLGVGRSLRDEPCQDIAAPAALVWPDARASDIAAKIGEVDGRLGSPAWESLRPDIDAWISAWSSARQSACEANRVEGTRSDVLFDRALACFDDRLRRVDAWLGLLEAGDVAAVRGIAERDVLPAFAVCSDTTYLLAQLDRPGDPEVAEQVDALRARMIELELRMQLGEIEAARTGIEAMAPEIERLGDVPLRAEWLEARGVLALFVTDYEAAERDLHESYMLARTAGANTEAAAAAIMLAHLDGVERRRFDSARVWIDHVRIDLARGAADPGIAATVEKVEGIVAEHEGRYDASIAHRLRAVEIAEETLGPMSVLRTKLELASALDGGGRHREAIELFESVLAEAEAAGGPDSAMMHDACTNLGLAYNGVGRHDDAIPMLERALRIATRMGGPDGLNVWANELNLGLALGSAGRTDEARAHLELARERVARLGPEFVADRALVASSLAWLAEQEERHEDALVGYREALVLHRQALPADHPELALQLSRMAEIAIGLGQLDEAAAALDEALAIWAKAGDAGTPAVAETWLIAGKLARARGDASAARARFEDVLARARTSDVPPEIRAAAERALAGP